MQLLYCKNLGVTWLALLAIIICQITNNVPDDIRIVNSLGSPSVLPKDISFKDKIEERELIEQVTWFVIEILENHEELSQTTEGMQSIRHMCQTHAIVLNRILNNVGIPSAIVGLTFQWVDRRWERGLHYVVKTASGFYVDAIPHSAPLINPNYKSHLILSPEDEMYNVYLRGEEETKGRYWGAISPENLESSYAWIVDEFFEIYGTKIEEFVYEVKGISESRHLNQYL